MNIPFFSSSKKKKKFEKKAKFPKIGKKVVIYSSRDCPWCAKTKEFFKANKIPFTNKDVANRKNADEMIKKSGQQGVPVVVVGSKVIIGYNEGKLRRELGV